MTSRNPYDDPQIAAALEGPAPEEPSARSFDYARQRQLEEQHAATGARRFQARITKARKLALMSSDNEGEAYTGAAIRLWRRSHRNMTKVVDYEMARIEGSPGRRPEWFRVVPKLGPDAAKRVSMLTSEALLARLGGLFVRQEFEWRLSLKSHCFGVTRRLLDELRFDRLEEAAPGLYQHNLHKATADAMGYSSMRRSLGEALRYANVDVQDLELTNSERVKVGYTLILMFLAATKDLNLSEDHEPGVYVVERIRSSGKWKLYLSPTPGALTWLLKNNEELASAFPVLGPMVVPPLPWNVDENGGYLTPAMVERVKFVTGPTGRKSPKQTEPAPYFAVNALQEVAWTINENVLDFVPLIEGMAMNRRESVAKVPSREDPVLPLPKVPYPEHCRGMTKEEKAEDPAWKKYKAHRFKMKLWHKKRNRLIAKRLRFDRLRDMAKEYRNDRRIFFVHHCDSRGRVYNVSDYLSPQGSDLEKALLEFADPDPLGPHGARRLMIHGATMHGATAKSALEDRVRWVREHSDWIEAIGRAPEDHVEEWTSAAEPWRFVAFCIEWACLLDHLEDGHPPETFRSGLRIEMDGSNNGIQHFAAMLLDPELAHLVNVSRTDEPQDFYAKLAGDVHGRIADHVADVREPRGAGEALRAQRVKLARCWAEHLDWIDRSACKKPGMTVGYSATEPTFARQIRAHFEDQYDDPDSPLSEAKMLRAFRSARLQGESPQTTLGKAYHYLASVLWECLEERIPQVFKTMAWMRYCVEVLVDNGMMPEWVSPEGFRVRLSYTEGRRERVALHGKQGRDHRVDVYEDTGVLRKKKHLNAVAPGLVHSQDAAALMRTVRDAVQVYGIQSLGMVHDSFSTTPGRAEDLAMCLRGVFQSLYKHDVLSAWRRQLILVAEERGVDVSWLPEPPVARGDLALDEVFTSDHFFA